MSTMERVASMDAVWLQIEQASGPMLVVGLMITQTHVDRQQLESQLKACLLPLPRFGQRVLHDRVGAVWETCPVGMQQHLVSTTLPPGAQREALGALIGTLAASPLDPGSPPVAVPPCRRLPGGQRTHCPDTSGACRRHCHHRPASLTGHPT